MLDKLYKILDSKAYHFIITAAFLWVMSLDAAKGKFFMAAVCAGFSVMGIYRLSQKVKEG